MQRIQTTNCIQRSFPPQRSFNYALRPDSLKFPERKCGLRAWKYFAASTAGCVSRNISATFEFSSFSPFFSGSGSSGGIRQSEAGWYVQSGTVGQRRICFHWNATASFVDLGSSYGGLAQHEQSSWGRVLPTLNNEHNGQRSVSFRGFCMWIRLPHNIRQSSASDCWHSVLDVIVVVNAQYVCSPFALI